MSPNENVASSLERVPSPKHVYVEVKDLPAFDQLRRRVQDVVARSTWWEKYGVDWAHVVGAVALIPLSLWLLRLPGFLPHALALFLLGCYHGTVANKTGHLAAHGSMAASRSLNRFLTVLCVEFCGGFPAKSAHGIHVMMHHPHTNIIGLGDSSTWKAPFLPAILYMFVMPLTLPVITPLVGFGTLLFGSDTYRPAHEKKHVISGTSLLQFAILFTTGFAFHCWLMTTFSGLTFTRAIIYTLVFRGVLSIPYIHINIFQHIGLPMYSPEHRPARLYQMASGCLNLDSNPFLNPTFGHSLISSHVEHHLFPKLSDHMCLKVRPIVRNFLKENSLPYHEDSYFGRVTEFVRNYDKLMVDQPPITHFVGLQ